MERLTRQEYIYNPPSIKAENLPSYTSVYWKLAEYEDTGLTPEEVNNLAVKWQGKELNLHIQELLDAEGKGLLFKLPCKVGDTVYDIDLGNPIPYKITGFSLGEIDEDYDIPDTKELYFFAQSTIAEQRFPISEIGETIFLTKEEAKQVLKEGRKS